MDKRFGNTMQYSHTPNLGGLVLGCIEIDFDKKIVIL